MHSFLYDFMSALHSTSTSSTTKTEWVLIPFSHEKLMSKKCSYLRPWKHCFKPELMNIWLTYNCGKTGRHTEITNDQGWQYGTVSSNLNMTYFKILRYRSNVTYPNKIFAYMLYLRTFHCMVRSKRTVLKGTTHRPIKALYVPHLRGTVPPQKIAKVLPKFSFFAL